MERSTPDKNGLFGHHVEFPQARTSAYDSGKGAQVSVATVSPLSSVIQSIDLTSINTIRTLSMDAVQSANSGHPGTPMAMAGRALQLPGLREPFRL
jgi:hypothetical protein